MAEQNTNFKISQAVVGLNNDSVIPQVKEGQMTFAKNANIANFDGNQVAYQNDQSNIKCFEKEGFRVIGNKSIIEQNRTIYFLYNPTTKDCEIGEKNNDECTYKTIISSKCLNFSDNYPIHQVVVKTTNCSTQIYWTDGYNPRRWIDLNDLPFEEIIDPNNEAKRIKIVGKVDCNKLLVQPNFKIPIITTKQVEVGGDIEWGAYQFAIQYANSIGEGYTSFYSITNPMGIYDAGKTTQDFNLKSTKAIDIAITDLDITGLYDYFNLVVIKTVNNITSVELVGTYAINGTTASVIYSGAVKTNIRLTINDIFERFPYYDIAQGVTTTDNSLLWNNLSIVQKINYQRIWSRVKLQWETWRVPYNRFEGYDNPINTEHYRGYMRDEVYAFEGCFILKNGKITESFHIPGRPATSYDVEIIDNDDALQFNQDPCDEPVSRKRWEVYNTATVTDFTDEFKAVADIDCHGSVNVGSDCDFNVDSCYKGSYQYGDFGYWESTEKYPNNTFIWGDLAAKPIMHPKMPDCGVSPMYDFRNGEYAIYPLGVRVDLKSLYDAINGSGLSQEEINQIQGFKIVRGNRANNKSVVAKGLLYNVGKYVYDNQTYYYPNYPFNDLRPDPFISSSVVQHHSGANTNSLLQGFNSEDSRTRYTFHSPDTSFYQPFGIDTGYIKLETIENGISKGHFVEIKDNAKYKFLTRDALRIAFAAALGSVVSYDFGGGALFGALPVAKLNPGNAPAAFSETLTLIRNLATAYNYGYQFNSVGEYNKSIKVPENGNKIRTITDGRYLTSAVESVGSDIVNNKNRESSVYLKTSKRLPYPHEQGGKIDASRYTLNQVGKCDTFSVQNFRDISSYYGAIKRVLPGQWGRMYSYETIDTGFYSPLKNEQNQLLTKLPTVFGGDCYINRFALKRKFPFFIDHTISRPDGADIALNLLGNVGYPVYFYGTNQPDITLNLGDLDDEINNIVDFSAGNIIINLLSGGIRPTVSALIIMSRIFQAYVDVLGVNNINLDCYDVKNLNELGKAYLFAYGIPYFFVESEVNVDYRQAIDPQSGNFYPNVGTDIPDDWLQETNVSIVEDNSYVYNKSYSKQNKETFFNHLREDFDPNKKCLVEYPNRIIYSEKSTLEETKNNWLIYKPINYFDFPKNWGPVAAVDGLEDRRLLVRFHNKSLLYNVFATVNTSVQTAYLGTPTFFSQPPLDFAETDNGYGGSQHKLFIKTELGHLTIDANRGQVFLFKGGGFEPISSKGLDKWFVENLEFQINKYFPAVNIDNHFKDIGLTGIYDILYNRFLITKKDYIPLRNDIQYDDNLGKFYVMEGKVAKFVLPTDPEYFCNISWTISYNNDTQSWISFHSYIPNFYNGDINYFDSGIQTDAGFSIWRHNTALTYGNFYGKQEDYVLEYPVSFMPNEEMIGSISDYTVVLKYTTKDVYHEVENDVYFNKAIIWNNQQCTGELDLVFKPKNNLAAYRAYPKFKPNSKEILVSKKDNLFSFNQFWNIVKEENKPFFTRPCNIPSLDKIFNVNLDYTIRSHEKAKMRSNRAKIRLIYNTSDQYKLISKFIITETQKSYE